METTIKEGEEFQIIRDPGNRVLYEGIAESDNEAQELLERYVLYSSASNNCTHALTFKIVKL